MTAHYEDHIMKTTSTPTIRLAASLRIRRASFGYCGVIDSVDSSRNTPRSHEVTT